MADLEALNAPLVTSRDPATGQHVDHPSYTVNKGGADVFFPVDFPLLRDLYRYLAQRDDRTSSGGGGGEGGGYRTRVVKSGRFLYEYGEWKEAETRSGYNPLIEDFRNTCVFLASAGPGAAVAGAGVVKKLEAVAGANVKKEKDEEEEKGKRP